MVQCSIVLQSECLAEIDPVLKLVQLQRARHVLVRVLRHRQFFRLQDDVAGLRARDDVHHCGSELLGRDELIILLLLVLLAQSVQDLLLEHLLLELTGVCLPCTEDGSADTHGTVAHRVLEVLLERVVEELEGLLRRCALVNANPSAFKLVRIDKG